MHFQTGLLPLFSLALVLAPCVDASAKNSGNDKSKKVPVLSDNSAGRGNAVTLPPSSVLVSDSSTTSLIQLVPEKSQFFERDELIKRFEELINKGRYQEIVELGKKMSDKELLKCVCQVVTTIDHFKGLYEYLKQRNMVPGFLAYGKTVLVRKVIVETRLLETYGLGKCDSIYDAIALSLKGGHYGRAAGLFEAAHKRPDWKHKFDLFVAGFFAKYPPEKDSMSLKRFLSLYGKVPSEKHSAIFKTICRELVWRLKLRLDNPGLQKLLLDLVGQLSLLVPAALAWGFLYMADDTHRANFIKYGYKEAIEEGLKKEYAEGGGKLWAVMVSALPNQFSGEYPGTDETRAVALKNLPTKRDLEEAWAERNAPNLLMKLEMLVPDLLPAVPLRIVSEYAVTWIAFLWGPQQNQLRPQISGQVAEKFKALMSEKRYGEVVELGNSMKKDVLAKHLYPLMTTTEHCMHLNGYLDSRGMLPNFLILGGMEVVREAILEFENMDSDYHISHDHICDAITFSIKWHRDDHTINLLRIERERHATADEQCKLVGETSQFEVLLKDFSKRLVENGDTAPFKRFLTINKEELDEGWPNIFEIMCQGMVYHLVATLGHPDYKKLLTDFVGQPSLMTTTAFTKGFLGRDFDFCRFNFIKYGWREAIQEGLKEEHLFGGRKLWAVMVSKYPNQFSGEYPGTDEARSIALKSLPTKQDLEEAWVKENAPSLRMKLEEFVPGLFPPAPLTIISEYAITWVIVLPSPPQKHLANIKAQGSVPGTFNKLQSGETRLDATAAQPKAVRSVVDKITKPLSTKRPPLEDIVDHSGLSSIDPYDDNPDTKYYLELGCRYLAQNHSKKYETESVQQKQEDAYYKNCFRAIWPGWSVETLPASKCHLKKLESFRKGDVLTHPDSQPSFVARADGFTLLRTTNYFWILYYHKDKPSMNLEVLSRLQWPHSRDLLSFANTDIKTLSARSRKERLNQFNFAIRLYSEHVKSTTFADLKRWVQCFDLSGYVPARLKSFSEQLSLNYPGIHLSKIHKLGTKTSIEPSYDPFDPIPPGDTIAFRYDPGVFIRPEDITCTRFSTIITDFEHQGSKYCLVLSFDVLG